MTPVQTAEEGPGVRGSESSDRLLDASSGGRAVSIRSQDCGMQRTLVGSRATSGRTPFPCDILAGSRVFKHASWKGCFGGTTDSYSPSRLKAISRSRSVGLQPTPRLPPALSWWNLATSPPFQPAWAGFPDSGFSHSQSALDPGARGDHHNIVHRPQ